MSQAKILSAAELRRVLNYVATRHHAPRNRLLVLMSHYAGLRAKELCALRYCDVLTSVGQIKSEIHLSPEQTKGRYGRTVYVCKKLQHEITQYTAAVPGKLPDAVLFPNQKSRTRGFTPNTMAQFFGQLYRNVGIDGASSHSGRRGFLTGLANKSVDIHVLKALAGHRSIQVTARYLYANPDQLRAAVDLL